MYMIMYRLYMYIYMCVYIYIYREREIHIKGDGEDARPDPRHPLRLREEAGGGQREPLL